jgi:hypothetical protein
MERLKRLGPWACGTILLLCVGLHVAACVGYFWLSTLKPRGAYYAVVDRVEPEIPGLAIKGTTAVTGAIEIVNDTGRDVFIYNQEGAEIIKSTSTGAFGKDKQGQWNRRLQLRNVVSFGGEPISYHDSIASFPSGEYNGQVMKTWEVHGRVEGTPFTIYGRTVYYTRQPTPTPTPHTPTP